MDSPSFATISFHQYIKLFDILKAYSLPLQKHSEDLYCFFMHVLILVVCLFLVKWSFQRKNKRQIKAIYYWFTSQLWIDTATYFKKQVQKLILKVMLLKDIQWYYINFILSIILCHSTLGSYFFLMIWTTNYFENCTAPFEETGQKKMQMWRTKHWLISFKNSKLIHIFLG